MPNLRNIFIDPEFRINDTFNLDNLIDLNDNIMWQNSGTWTNFGDDLWSSKSSKWANKHWNQFYGLGGDLQKHIEKTIDDAFEQAAKDIEIAFDKQTKQLKVQQNNTKTKYLSKGEIIFSYNPMEDFSFKMQWDDNTKRLIEIFNRANITASVDLDSGEFDRSKNEVKGVFKFSYNNFVSSDFDEFIKNYILSNVFTCTAVFRENHHIKFEKISLNLKTGGLETIFDYKVDREPTIQKKQPAPIVEKIIEVVEEHKAAEENIPKWLKILDDTKKRFRKRTFEIVKKIDTIDDIPVNCLIVRQIRGDKDRKKYTLNEADCELLGIEYKDNLEILPNDLEYENVYKKVKNENYKENE